MPDVADVALDCTQTADFFIFIKYSVFGVIQGWDITCIPYLFVYTRMHEFTRTPHKTLSELGNVCAIFAFCIWLVEQMWN